jgi:uncharacterized OB-fold protein
MTNAQEFFSFPYFRCGDCGHSILTEKKACPKCGSFSLEKKQSQGKGTLIDTAITYFPPKNYESIAPYTSILVKMGEGFKIFGIIEGEHKDLDPGIYVLAVRQDEKAGGIIFKAL